MRLGFLPAVVLSLVTGSALAADTVGQWERFETAVENSKTYADPFRDVTLDVTYTRPDGSTVKFWGFHDGGKTWKLRFMPDHLGTWQYEAKFSDGTSGAKGQFDCVASDTPGMVTTYEANPTWFGFKDGRGGSPFFMRSFHVGDRFFAENWPAEQRTEFLDWAVKQGYNTLSIASHYLNRDVAGRGRGWDTPKLWPLAPAEYRKVEVILDDLARRKIVVFPFAGFYGRNSNFPTDSKEQELCIRYMLARFGPYWNILLNAAGPEPYLKNKAYMSFEQIHELGRLIRRLDVFGHPLTVHNQTGDDQFKEADWLTFGTLQGPKTVDRVKLGTGLVENHHPAKPLYAQETLWAGNTQGHPKYTETDLRKNAYVIALSGAVLNFGDMVGNSSTGFSGTLDLADKIQARHDIVKQVWDVVESVPYYRMKPRPDLVSTGHCLADDGREYLVYLDTPKTVDVSVRGGPYRVEWINAQNTAERKAGETTADGKGLTPPAGGDDWLLRLTATADKQQPAVSRSGSAPEVVGRGTNPDVAVDAKGTIHVVYGRDDRIYYRQYDAAARQWRPEEFTGIARGANKSPLTVADPDIVLDAAGTPHVIGWSGYAHRTASGWKTLPTGVVRDTELAIAPDESLYLIHRGGNHGGLIGVKKLTPDGAAFVPVADPDLPDKGSNDHVYGDLAIGPDGSLHVIYRHAAPKKVSYRRSDDGGKTWPIREGITDREPEGPHVAVGPDGEVFAADGAGYVYRRAGGKWVEDGRAVTAQSRQHPDLIVHPTGAVFIGCWGGRVNVRRPDGGWIGERTIPSVTGTAVGFVEMASTPDGVVAVWEEANGSGVHEERPAADIVVGRILPSGVVLGLPQASRK